MITRDIDLLLYKKRASNRPICGNTFEFINCPIKILFWFYQFNSKK